MQLRKDKFNQVDSSKRQRMLFILIIVVLVLTNVGSFVWFSRQSNSAQDYAITHPYIDASRNFIAQEHFIVNLQPLREELRAMADEFGNNEASIYIEFLNTGANIAINQDNYIWPASLVKVPLAMAVMKKIEDKVWKFSNELVLLAGDRDDDSGAVGEAVWEHPIGTRLTIELLLKELLINSDNTAHNILYRNLDADDVEQVIEALGIETLFDQIGKVSAKDYSRIFRSLYNASFLNRENSQQVLEWLDAAVFDEFLTYPLPKQLSFPHKYGENFDVRAYADSGIIYIPNRPYLITVMVQGDLNAPLEQDKQRAAEFMRLASQKTYEYFSSY